MSTDMYGVRVLGVDPGALRARLRIFVVYYLTHEQTHASLPDGDDLGFFFKMLWDAAYNHPELEPYDVLMVTMDQFLDDDWVDANSQRYVRQVTRVAARNHPVTGDHWAGLEDFYYEDDGQWQDEDRLVQADYDVEVTDTRWLAALFPGHSWGTPVYSTSPSPPPSC
ncbi:hypothetical protein ACGF0J_29000 [Nonomuraea sp. NPDC047897]|uniref:hypothetical protein n=1 Tax=Nonomuraea sp. NPDC047897 TaxID=3364346 RepID=UPI00371E6F6B